MYRKPEESALPVARLRGMSDLTGLTLQRSYRLQRVLISLLDSFGYLPLETPLLEATELFLRKSGGELASQLLSFNDPLGRAVSLRPEFTAPAIRHYLEHSADIDLPARWRYCGPVFRFSGVGPGDETPARSQFTQIGAELLGGPSIMADVELLTLATSALDKAGVSGWTLRLADLDVLNSLLDPVGLSDRARAFVVQNVPRLVDDGEAVTELMEESRRLHVVGQFSEGEYLSQAVQGLDDDEARSVLLGVLRSNPLDQLGQRTPEEVVERLLRKIRRPDSEEGLRVALQSASELARVRGGSEAALAGASAVLRRAGADTSAVGRLERVLALLPHHQVGSGEVVLDFGLVRGLAYYNGIVFEVSHPGSPQPLGGGGRYDGLARDLGGDGHLPALGFAYSLDALAELTCDFACEDVERVGVLVLASSNEASLQAMSTAAAIRNQGEVAEVEVGGLTLSDALSYARRRGLRWVTTVECDGTTRTHDV